MCLCRGRLAITWICPPPLKCQMRTYFICKLLPGKLFQWLLTYMYLYKKHTRLTPPPPTSLSSLRSVFRFHPLDENSLIRAYISIQKYALRLLLFIRPSSDGTYYGMVMSVCPSVRVSVRPTLRPSVRPTLRPSVRPGLCPPVFHTFLQHALRYWAKILHMTLFYCTTDQVRVSSISVKFCASYAPFVTYNTGNTLFSALYSYILWPIELKLCIRLCFTVLQIKFECCQFASIFWELCPFWNYQYWKYTVFRTFLQHALTYWAEILHMTLVYCTTDQVRVSLLCVNFCGSYAPFGT